MRIRCGEALRLGASECYWPVFYVFLYDPQVIPELKQQVTELQKQKQEIEANLQEQRRELAGKYELFLKFLSHSD